MRAPGRRNPFFPAGLLCVLQVKIWLNWHPFSSEMSHVNRTSPLTLYMQFMLIWIAVRRIKTQFLGGFGTVNKPSLAALRIAALLLASLGYQVHAQTPQPPEMVTFSNWVTRYRTEMRPNAAQSSVVAEGVTAARQRRARLKTFMASDPRTALAASESIANPTDLPPEIQQELETPFSNRRRFYRRGPCPLKARTGGGTVAPLQSNT